MNIRHLALLGALAIATPAVSQAATPQWGQGPRAPQVALNGAYNEGYQRGLRAGAEDARRGDRFNFADEGDYRRADAGYRSQHGYRDGYRDQFRRGFEVGYRSGYERNDTRGGYNGRGSYPGGYDGGVYDDRRPGPWTNGRAVGRNDPAWAQGFNDGYDEGRKDGRDRRRMDPVAESRYRSADRGYDSRYGPRELYKQTYRDAFREGYVRGYQEYR